MNKKYRFISPLLGFVVALLLVVTPAFAAPPFQQTDDPNPPSEPVKLIFIHHSTGENWLTDGYGNLGRTLDENNYFVSDTNYGWGPDSIGDNTDIPNWVDWFASDRTSVYTDALYNESGQNSYYTRTLQDPGGENQIIMFKSCFPNSALEGSPNDPPDPDGWLTVGHAKYVYNEILQYFASRPDKLFIVITAPPLSDSSYAQNARAFNNWLLNDWLDENNYSLPNVAVFDFYNILTSRNAHHRWNDGQIEHITGDRNTLAYPSGDDHPSEAGSQKATEEFIPLLNVFYHRWIATAPDQVQPDDTPSSGSDLDSGSDSVSGSTIANFDDINPSVVPYWDEATSTQISCSISSDDAYAGVSSLRIDFDVTAGSWSTCVLSYDEIQNWSQGNGITFAIHANRASIPYEVAIYSGTPDNRETYLDYADTPADSVDGWAIIEIPWSDFLRADWEANAGTQFSGNANVLGLAFGFSAGDSANSGSVWVDEVNLLGTVPNPDVEEPSEVEGQEESEDAEESGRGFRLPCLGTIIFPTLLAGMVIIKRKRQRINPE